MFQGISLVTQNYINPAIDTIKKKGIVSNLSCSRCSAFVLVYYPIGEENEQDNIRQDTEVDKEVRKNA